MQSASYQDFLDLDVLRPEQSEAHSGFAGVVGQWKNFEFYARMHWNKNKCFSVRSSSGDLLAVFGYINLFQDTYEDWMLVNGNAVNIAKAEALRVVRAGKEFVAALPVGRHQTTVRVDFPVGQRFIETLSFLREGTLRKYVDGLDVHLYSYIKD